MDFIIEVSVALLLLISGFALLIKGADWFVDGSAGIARKMGVSRMVIALTLVAMGTSIPETAVSLQAALSGSGDLAVGNIVGTNTLNILLILGITAVIAPMYVQKFTAFFEMPIMIITAVVFGATGVGRALLNPEIAKDGFISRWEGVLLLVLFGAYIFYLCWLAKKSQGKNAIVVMERSVEWWKLILIVVIGLALIIGGSSLTVAGAVKIAKHCGISERFIGLTIVALGTSLPELATSITAAIKKQDDLAVGNIVGSNIYNMLFIGGLTAVIKPVPYSGSFAMDSAICVAASGLLWLIVMFNPESKLNRKSGILMLMCYAGYLAWLILK